MMPARVENVFIPYRMQRSIDKFSDRVPDKLHVWIDAPIGLIGWLSALFGTTAGFMYGSWVRIFVNTWLGVALIFILVYLALVIAESARAFLGDGWVYKGGEAT